MITGKKYMLCPVYVISKNDGQMHWINAARLAELYRVPISECIQEKDTRGMYTGDLIRLSPKFDGNYSLPVGD